MRLAGVVVSLLIGAILTVLYLRVFTPKPVDVGASLSAIERTRDRVHEVEVQQRRYDTELQDAAH